MLEDSGRVLVADGGYAKTQV